MHAPAFFATLCLFAASAAHAQDGTGPVMPSITVQGQASAQVAPDTVVVVFGVVTERPTAGAAMNDNNKALASAIAAIKAEAVKPEDIATTSASLTPEMDRTDEEAPRIVGYRAENQLQVRFQPPERAGEILANLVDKGVNDVESVSAIVSDDASLRDRLKADATRNARREAEIYATALDLKLGPVSRIDPEPSSVMARFDAVPRKAAIPAPVPIAPGQQTVTESVRVTFSLQR